MDAFKKRPGEEVGDAAEQKMSINKDTLKDLDSPDAGADAVKGGRVAVTGTCGDYPVSAVCTVG
ncbi:MAG TPA: hypothetical protein VKA84_18220 [Gemmatimonadaceae bacterium]|nr:hypothetical protein [Gemmatimonadaceae bacterium]